MDDVGIFEYYDAVLLYIMIHYYYNTSILYYE